MRNDKSCLICRAEFKPGVVFGDWSECQYCGVLLCPDCRTFYKHPNVDKFCPGCKSIVANQMRVLYQQRCASGEDADSINGRTTS